MVGLREILGVVGAVIGGIYGGGQGAQWGFMIGSTIGAYLDPEEIRGPKPGEAPTQTSRDGVPIPIIWGVHHCHGNIIQVNPIQEIETSESGKGSTTEVITTRRLRTFAIGVCKGPVAGVRRIWENEKLVVDLRENPAIPIEETQKYFENIRIYLGGEDQLPDPDLEAHTGVGECPFYRGLCYIVWVNYDITDFGSAIPQFRFEVERGRDLSASSKPYAVAATNSLDITCNMSGGALRPIPEDFNDAELTLIDAQMEVRLHSQTQEDHNDAELTLIMAVMGPKLESYGPDSDHNDAALTLEDAQMRLALIRYEIPDEALDITCNVTGGSMTTP